MGEMTLTQAQREFLECLRDGGKLPLADRAEDRVRQKCRRLGYAAVVMNPRRWVITDAGREALEDEPFEVIGPAEPGEPWGDYWARKI